MVLLPRLLIEDFIKMAQGCLGHALQTVIAEGLGLGNGGSE
jgi:hypothetical protein